MKPTPTIAHSTSSYGIPVFVDRDTNQPLDYAQGVRLLRRSLGLSVWELAEHCGVSPRTVEGWEQGRLPSKPALLLMARLLPDTRS